MPTPHKHADLIKAWADDPSITIQCRSDKLNTKWHTLPHREVPYWDEALEYRIEPKTIKYRVALVNFMGVPTPMCVFSNTNPTLIKWLGDWQEIEV